MQKRTTAHVRSLDNFNRFIEKKTATSAAAEKPKETESAADKAASNGANGANGTRYVLRGGITIAVPLAKPDAADTEIVAKDAGAPPPSAPVAKQEIKAEPKVSDEDAAAATRHDAQLWQGVPRHIRLLMQLADNQEEEAAQKYYTRSFRESRRQLIERLLDPTLTLEDTARVLGVVPATVRRYTNRGVLPHHRTVGQQRRFKLSDVLAFLEAQQAGKIPDTTAADDDADDGPEADA